MSESTAVAGKAVRVAAGVPTHACPESKILRERLRAMAADLVASWKTDGLPAVARTAGGLRGHADSIVRRGGGSPEHVGWTMVTIVSEYWRDRLARGPNGRRLLLLPDCPLVVAADGAAAGVHVAAQHDATVPRVCGPGCGIGTIWSAARDTGWVVESTDRAVAAIGGMLTGQYDGILGVARLSHLEKAFAMLPAFTLPVAAVPCEPPEEAASTGRGCAEALASAAIDVEWVLGLLGVAGGGAAEVGDYLPLLREAAETFTPQGLGTLAARLGMEPSFGLDLTRAAAVPVAAAIPPLDAAESVAGEFVVRGGKFLRPFITLSAFDAVRADRRSGPVAAGYAVEESTVRDAVKAAAVAIEVFHKASLVHDDIEDGDRVRYGRPTVHESCGAASAINVGDYLLGIGYRIASSLPGVDAATLRDVVRILADAHVRLARGQGAELWWRDVGDRTLSSQDSLEMYGLKTSPAFEAAVAIGIRLAGLVPSEVGAVDRYAVHVGTGFQVLNDLKDWAGDLENDRRAAGDLLGGRPTLMWALAIERLPATEVQRLRRLAADAGRPDAAESEVARCVAEVRGLYEKAEVFGRAARIVADQRAQAAAAAATCRQGRLREVLEFLLDLAVPEAASGGFGG